MRRHEIDKLWCVNDLISYLGIGRSTYHSLLKKGDLPAGIKLSGSWRWDPQTVKDWAVDSRRCPYPISNSPQGKKNRGRPRKAEQVESRKRGDVK